MVCEDVDHCIVDNLIQLLMTCVCAQETYPYILGEYRQFIYKCKCNFSSDVLLQDMLLGTTK